MGVAATLAREGLAPQDPTQEVAYALIEGLFGSTVIPKPLNINLSPEPPFLNVS